MKTFDAMGISKDLHHCDDIATRFAALDETARRKDLMKWRGQKPEAKGQPGAKSERGCFWREVLKRAKKANQGRLLVP